MTWLQRYQLRRTFHGSLGLLPVLAIGLVLVVAPLDGAGPTARRAGPGSISCRRRTDDSGCVHVIDADFYGFRRVVVVDCRATGQCTVDACASSPRCLRTGASSGSSALSPLPTRILSPPRAESMTRRRSCPLRLPSFATWCASPFSSGLYHGSVGSLRRSAVLEAVAEEGRGVVESVYPEPFHPAEEQQGWSAAPESDASIVEHVGTSGVVLAFDQRGLAAIAERADVVIEVVPQVGDFVARGGPLFRVRSGGRPVDIGGLRASVAIGPERTMEQDPRFAFRILVDVANKALSPGINDPTTAVLALDQIHRFLMYVGRRRLDAGARVCPSAGCACATERRTGSISSASRSRKSAITGPAACRWCAGSRPCSNTCCAYYPRHVRPVGTGTRLLQRATQRAFADEEDRALRGRGRLAGYRQFGVIVVPLLASVGSVQMSSELQ